MHRALFLALAVASSSLLVSPARADEGARVEARTLAEQGDAQFYAGRCDKAVPLWRRAVAVYRAPTIVLRIARCQAIVGQVVAAAATLVSMVDEPIPPDAPPAFAVAREDGRRELPRVRARIASLRIEVRPHGAEVPVAVEIDGAPAIVGPTPIAIDPGTHTVLVRAGSAGGAPAGSTDGPSFQRVVHLDDGESSTLEVPLWVEPLSALPRGQRVAGFSIFGLGVAALATGVGFSVSAMSTARTLEGVCATNGALCSVPTHVAMERTHAYALAGDGTLIAGAVLAAAGAFLFSVDLHLTRESQVRFAASPRGVLLGGSL
jgi:hypothetical protein